MTEQQLEAMRVGREAAQQRRTIQAQGRVQRYKKWLREERVAYDAYRSELAGPEETAAWTSLLAEMPPIPTDADYRLAGAV